MPPFERFPHTCLFCGCHKSPMPTSNYCEDHLTTRRRELSQAMKHGLPPDTLYCKHGLCLEYAVEGKHYCKRHEPELAEGFIRLTADMKAKIREAMPDRVEPINPNITVEGVNGDYVTLRVDHIMCMSFKDNHVVLRLEVGNTELKVHVTYSAHVQLQQRMEAYYGGKLCVHSYEKP